MKKSLKFASASLFFVIPAILLFSAAAETAIDRNNDGKPDRWVTTLPDGGQIIKSDNSYDGKVDYILEIDNAGSKVFEQVDFNHDGEMDDFYYYKNGVLERQEIDTNFDKNIDVWIYLEEGIYIIKIERDKNHDGVIDYTKKYK